MEAEEKDEMRLFDLLPDLTESAPRRFRGLLAQSKAGEPLDRASQTELVRTLRLLGAAQQPALSAERCACACVAAEAVLMGGERALRGARRVETAAQAACFLARWTRWIRAREAMPLRVLASKWVASPEAPIISSGMIESEALVALRTPGYLRYSTVDYDFRAILLRMFAADTPAAECVARDSADPLARLHDSERGRAELGYADLDGVRSGTLLRYTKPLDAATRYGCGAFNRVWKTSPERPAFLALYHRFIEQVVAPTLADTRLLYQAVPVFRVFLPNHLAVGPRHTDAGYHRQPNEINFWLPFTDAYETNSLQAESEAGAGDFSPVTCSYGEAYYFRGNECEHFTQLNVSRSTRISIDFRVIRSAELPLCPVAEAGQPDAAKGASEYFTVGRYYQRTGSPPCVAATAAGAGPARRARSGEVGAFRTVA